MFSPLRTHLPLCSIAITDYIFSSPPSLGCLTHRVYALPKQQSPQQGNLSAAARETSHGISRHRSAIRRRHILFHSRSRGGVAAAAAASKKQQAAVTRDSGQVELPGSVTACLRFSVQGDPTWWHPTKAVSFVSLLLVEPSQMGLFQTRRYVRHRLCSTIGQNRRGEDANWWGI